MHMTKHQPSAPDTSAPLLPPIILHSGTPLTNECIGKSDKRYDPGYTNDLKDQNDVWKNMEGYWVMEEKWYNNEGLPIENTAGSPILTAMAEGSPAAGKHSTFPLHRFINVTGELGYANCIVCLLLFGIVALSNISPQSTLVLTFVARSLLARLI